MHDLANGLAALRLWLVELQRQALCEQCTGRQSESLATMRRIVAELEQRCEQLREMTRDPMASAGAVGQ